MIVTCSATTKSQLLKDQKLIKLSQRVNHLLLKKRDSVQS